LLQFLLGVPFHAPMIQMEFFLATMPVQPIASRTVKTTPDHQQMLRCQPAWLFNNADSVRSGKQQANDLISRHHCCQEANALTQPDCRWDRRQQRGSARTCLFRGKNEIVAATPGWFDVRSSHFVRFLSPTGQSAASKDKGRVVQPSL